LTFSNQSNTVRVSDHPITGYRDHPMAQRPLRIGELLRTYRDGKFFVGIIGNVSIPFSSGNRFRKPAISH
jgi:hypothetical protein